MLGERIAKKLAPEAGALRLLTSIPGVRQRTAEVLIAEIGTG